MRTDIVNLFAFMERGTVDTCCDFKIELYVGKPWFAYVQF